MTAIEIELISKKTRYVIAAAIHTIEYTETIIKQSKRLIRGIDEARLQRGAELVRLRQNQQVGMDQSTLSSAVSVHALSLGAARRHVPDKTAHVARPVR